MNLHLPTHDRLRAAPTELSEEDSFRERRHAVRHHRRRTRISWLVRNAAWGVGLLALGGVILTSLVGLLLRQ